MSLLNRAALECTIEERILKRQRFWLRSLDTTGFMGLLSRVTLVYS